MDRLVGRQAGGMWDVGCGGTAGLLKDIDWLPSELANWVQEGARALLVAFFYVVPQTSLALSAI